MQNPLLLQTFSFDRSLRALQSKKPNRYKIAILAIDKSRLSHKLRGDLALIGLQTETVYARRLGHRGSSSPALLVSPFIEMEFGIAPKGRLLFGCFPESGFRLST
jgi:hypothetical protein